MASRIRPAILRNHSYGVSSDLEFRYSLDFTLMYETERDEIYRLR
jgi:hypothetical protein